MNSLALLLIFYLFVTTTGYWLRLINLNYLKKHGTEVPAGFENTINKDILAKTTAYTLEKSRLGLKESVINNIIVIFFLFGGLITLYDQWILSLSHSFIISGMLFFIILALVQTLIEIPFSFYDTFTIESRYGFNTTTKRLWLTDLFKSILISLLILSIMVSAALGLIKWSSGFWWLWLWGFFVVFSIFLMYIAPYVIEPLFFKFSPIEEKSLEDKIMEMMEKAKVKVSRVVQVDASRRSHHSNAYFSGIGRVKKIVLFDTLLKQMTQEEIIAVLAHELGHWKKGHIRKKLIMIETVSLLSFYLAYHLLAWGGLPGLLNLTQLSLPAQFVILMFLGSLVVFPLTPLSSWLSRNHERQADQFGCELSGDPEALASALIKLSGENLANLHPHPFYASFYYSHPPVIERVNWLKHYEKMG
ncbi:MAG TPA: M48 family metallopeptidase [Syntrophales bacterium]|nr:M48 family metallopeptidase [Smithellaceae bacterium]HPX80661.1 M48 family metallopeptidase [Syntrophales bacterium]